LHATGTDSFFAETTLSVLTALTFNDLSLTVTEDGGLVLAPTLLGSDNGPGYTYYDSANFADTQNFLSATLTGNISPTVVTLSDGSTALLGGSFSATIMPSLGVDLTASTDFVAINVESGPVTAPEPSTFVFLVLGFLLVFGLLLSRVPQLV
jgi:hypothetical protein